MRRVWYLLIGLSLCGYGQDLPPAQQGAGAGTITTDSSPFTTLPSGGFRVLSSTFSYTYAISGMPRCDVHAREEGQAMAQTPIHCYDRQDQDAYGCGYASTTLSAVEYRGSFLPQGMRSLGDITTEDLCGDGHCDAGSMPRAGTNAAWANCPSMTCASLLDATSEGTRSDSVVHAESPTLMISMQLPPNVLYIP
jgi:hypothetical protein